MKQNVNSVVRKYFSWIQGSRDDVVVRALSSHQCGRATGWRFNKTYYYYITMWPGSIPARCHMWIEFVGWFSLCSEGFSPCSPVFLSAKTNISKLFSSTRIEGPHGKPLNIVINLFMLSYYEKLPHWYRISELQREGSLGYPMLSDYQSGSIVYRTQIRNSQLANQKPTPPRWYPKISSHWPDIPR